MNKDRTYIIMVAHLAFKMHYDVIEIANVELE